MSDAPIDRWRWVRRTAPWVITAGVVAAILVQYPVARIVDEMRGGDTLAMVPVALAGVAVLWLTGTTSDWLLVGPVVGGVRWLALLKAKGAISVLNAFGLAFNFGGYAVWIQRRFGARAGAAAGTVAMIALLDLATVATIASAALWIAAPPAGVADARALAIATTAIAAVALVAGVAVRPRQVPRSFGAPWRDVPRARRALSLACRAGTITVLIVSTWAAARAFGLAVPLAAVASYLPILLAIGALPINVGGFGPVQAAWLTLFSPWASGERILAFQFLWHLAMLGALVIRGAPFLRGVIDDIAAKR